MGKTCVNWRPYVNNGSYPFKTLVNFAHNGYFCLYVWKASQNLSGFPSQNTGIFLKQFHAGQPFYKASAY